MAADASAGGGAAPVASAQQGAARPLEVAKLRWPGAFDWAGRHSPEEYLKERVRSLWEARDQGDFVLNVRGEELRVHGCMLAAASPVFRAMLSSEMLESTQRLASLDAEPEDVTAMLRFAYFGELSEVEPGQLPGILHLAHAYEMVELVPLCCDYMIQHLTGDTAVPYVRVLRLLEGVPMDLASSAAAAAAKEGVPQAAPQAQEHVARALPGGGTGQLQAQSVAGVTSLFGAPPEQPQQANIASLFRDPSEQPSLPQQSTRIAAGAFGSQVGHQPRQPAVSRQPQLLVRGVAGAAGGANAVQASLPEEGAEAGAGTAAVEEGEPSEEAAKRGRDFEVCPIAHTFVTIARLIASSPELQMATLRYL